MACGPRILEAGVGTGLSLGYYRGDAEVYGVDLSEDMLQPGQGQGRAERAVAGEEPAGHGRVPARLTPDESFDAVTAQFLITLVPDPEGALGEFARVLKPGGEIVLANHFGQADGPLARLEEAAAPFFSKIGWSSDFKVARVEAWTRATPLKIVELKPVFPGGFFKILRLRKAGGAASVS